MGRFSFLSRSFFGGSSHSVFRLKLTLSPGIVHLGDPLHCATRPFLKHIHQKDSIIRETYPPSASAQSKSAFTEANKTRSSPIDPDAPHVQRAPPALFRAAWREGQPNVLNVLANTEDGVVVRQLSGNNFQTLHIIKNPPIVEISPVMVE
ncbi:Uncharacterized protein HZ326_22519 [Fusarium oxysporum f. sp. albedinis]|nr:Uncharacterized protein HZ326_22519 [Fusarium oxysporum f. sp. albedinis]